MTSRIKAKKRPWLKKFHELSTPTTSGMLENHNSSQIEDLRHSHLAKNSDSKNSTSSSSKISYCHINFSSYSSPTFSYSLFLVLIFFTAFSQALERVHEFQRYDGWFNNLANPQWGSVGSRLHRDAPSNYQDGVYRISEDLPSARAISDLIFRGPAGIPSQRNLTTMLAFFSQVVAYEIMQSTQISCPLEMHKIPVPRCDPVFDSECEGKTEIPFVRAKYDKETGHGLNSPREQTNDRTSWIDASFLYSTQEPWVSALRSWENGTLAENDFMPGYPPLNGHHIPLNNPAPPQIHRLMNPDRLFILGDPRINENPGLLSFGLILYRWHNVQTERLRNDAKTKDWTDEELFQAARRMVVATLQKIILYDFVPALLADNKAIPSYDGYKPHVPPGISHSFATTAFRFPHSIVPPALLLRKRGNGNGTHCEFRNEVAGYPALRLCQNWWNAQDIVAEYSVDEIVLGMASQIAEAEDNIVVEDLRDFIFGPMHFTRLDVVSSSIMRGRDNGLPSYNELRKRFLLPEKNWSTINPQLYAQFPEVFQMLAELYKNKIENLDAYVGGMLETNGVGPGELFSVIIKDQFIRLRDSDRFWFENNLTGIFDKKDLEYIWGVNLRDIISQTTQISIDDLQENVFYWRDGDPCPQPFQVNISGLEPCVPFMRFDHFTGNEVTYIFTCIGLATIPIICIGIGYLLIQRRKKLGLLFEPAEAKFAAKYTNGVNGMQTLDFSKLMKEQTFSLPAIEWLNETFCRSVTVNVDYISQSIRLEKPRAKGSVLRKLDLSQANAIRVAVTKKSSRGINGPFVVISVPRNYDMVLRLQSETHWLQFRHALGRCVGREKQIIEVEADTVVLLEAAETKDKRQQKLDHFFREAYSKAFNIKELSDPNNAYADVPPEEVLEMTLSKEEFADALGMRKDDLFVERLFSCMAYDGNTTKEYVTFQAFLEVLRKFTQGTLKEKLKLIFEMCDRNRDKVVQKDEFCALVKSLNMAVGVKIDQRLQDNVVDTVLYRAGIDASQKTLTYEDFEAIFTTTTDSIRRPLGVHLRGASLKVNLEETDSLNSFAVTSEETDCYRASWISLYLSYIECYRQHIVILFMFFMINIIVFMERFWHYRYEEEHRDLRRVMGVGIAITRGAAAGISFCLALVLPTVCRNIMTLARETPIGEYIPLDAAITFHKIVAITAGFWSAVHTIGHCINFYHVATQSQEGLACLFQEAVFGSNFMPSISYWFFSTITGITGILLVSVMSIIYVFSAPAIMKRAYHAFRFTHLLVILLYALTVLHGLPKLLDTPKFWYYVIGPIILFIIDRIIGMRQQYKQLQILQAAILPSDIIYIKFKRPHSFKFRSGQWIRISCPAFSCTFNEHHAFSLASAPQEKTIELYIKAVGPWTWKLRNEIIEAHGSGLSYPVINLSGPFGEGNQEWHNYEVCVMIGGGIGVTPYASTLMDLVLETSSGNHCDVKCKKVYFLWICPTHKNFEWFIDVLKQVETRDINRVLEIHIFVTQFFHKFDLRTTMLYICERHFRGDNKGKSMFTSLRATNHFGRPNFDVFLKFLQHRHQETNEIGVFSCGPGPINKQIREACIEANRARNAPSFHHRFETF